jgi:hypothetical protein
VQVTFCDSPCKVPSYDQTDRQPYHPSTHQVPKGNCGHSDSRTSGGLYCGDFSGDSAICSSNDQLSKLLIEKIVSKNTSPPSYDGIALSVRGSNEANGPPTLTVIVSITETSNASKQNNERQPWSQLIRKSSSSTDSFHFGQQVTSKNDVDVEREYWK